MKKLFLLLLAVLLCTFSYAQTDTVRVSTKGIRIKQVKAGTRQYLVTIQTPQAPNVLRQSLWNRNVSFENYQGKERMVVRQNWIGADTLSNRTILTVCEKDFTPIYQTSTSARGTAAFNFEKGRIVGADSVKSNGFKGFAMPSPEPTFDWELDMEFFESLPLKANTVFLINFYHPGSTTGPQYYAYKVVGSEKLLTVNNATTDCWLLRIDYSSTSHATFWVSKKAHEVLKMEEVFNGTRRNKIKLSTTAGKYI
ncbi:hypothetical protein [uncultured Pontibacter sp.]|uniref:DUF3108 domain-containing protein n=1 Tax=uncultured Pontibacter sp. TaxID=453356 RepID=UPI00261F6D96|nr:hypothetical protein [uncultured Pontibacter sp.]